VNASKYVCRPGPYWGNLQCSLDPLAGVEGGKEGIEDREGRVKKGKGRGGRGRGRSDSRQKSWLRLYKIQVIQVTVAKHCS